MFRGPVAQSNMIPSRRDAAHALAADQEGALGLSVGRFRVGTIDISLTAEEQEIVDRFHALSYRRWNEGFGTLALSWLGYQALKCPMDMWIYQELLVEQRPDFIIECGTCYGGSAYYFASLCQLLDRGRVITIDSVDVPDRPQHGRITYLLGRSTEPETLDRVRALIGSSKNCLVILDSDHSQQNVLAELQAYHGFVPVGGYLVVEDTNVHGHPVFHQHGPGPMEAVDEFLAVNPHFESDRSRERFLMTLYPRGYLRRVT